LVPSVACFLFFFIEHMKLIIIIMVW